MFDYIPWSVHIDLFCFASFFPLKFDQACNNIDVDDDDDDYNNSQVIMAH
jgi:hypothetical protein